MSYNLKFWMIVRELESGGETCVGLNVFGDPTYINKEHSLKFADEQSAKHYLVYCEKHMRKLEGQKGFKVVQSEI